MGRGLHRPATRPYGYTLDTWEAVGRLSEERVRLTRILVSLIKTGVFGYDIAGEHFNMVFGARHCH